MPFLDVNGVRIAYLVWAPAAGMQATGTVLLLHALTGRAALWQPIASRLTPAGISVVAMDLRGHGDSDRASDYGIETLTADAARLIEEHGAAPIDVLGHSIGGTVAWTLAATRPDLIRRLVIEDQRPAGDARHETYWKKWADNWPWTLPSKEAGLAYLRSHDRARAWWEPSLIATQDGRWGWAFDRDAIVQMAAGLHARSDWETLGLLHAPTLIIRGEQSAHVKPDVAERMAATIPSARVVTIAGADHWVNRRAAPYAAAVIDFLTSAALRRS
jgi:pimeloyl-ACP methyl ester carboxylesterase